MTPKRDLELEDDDVRIDGARTLVTRRLELTVGLLGWLVSYKLLV